MSSALPGHIFTVYEVRHVDSDEDGRHTWERRIGVFVTHSLAVLAAHKQGPWNSDGKIVERQAITSSEGKVYLLDGTEVVDLDQEQERAKAALRAKALAKLSPAERVALELPDE